ncbi:MAG: 4-hydroxy-3-methylbut-2-enyl diphosphate reductase [Candidatus Hatepunaea meridiana]|nr:4-hydroxy-3-methylbut-2-enyl diphosphate reductase [Candidatus Hatepunaea meridiana]
MKVILDPQGGICGGVRRVIELAEKEIATKNRKVFVLGDIIHNEREVDRLNKAGLNTIHIKSLENIKPSFKLRQVLTPDATAVQDARILIRAHGEPPETFAKLKKFKIEVVDGTCPVVLKSQNLAQKYYYNGYQVAIVGKHGHPEMIGIIGHTNHDAIVIEYDEDVKKLSPDKPTLVMAQTTISPEKFEEMSEKIKDWVGNITIRCTICESVVKRGEKLHEFAKQVDVLLVVGGRKSSNTKMLHNACLSVNPNSYHVATPEEIDTIWFKDLETIGVTGSASTPLWLLQEFVDTLELWIKEEKSVKSAQSAVRES